MSYEIGHFNNNDNLLCFKVNIDGIRKSIIYNKDTSRFFAIDSPKRATGRELIRNESLFNKNEEML